ncbi:variable surface lipoprotein [Mycoplasmopsis bovis]
MKKINKIIISLSSIISISSMPLIAASCENKNPTDESIINNITPPQTQGNLNQEDNSKEKEQKNDPSGSGNSSSNTNPQTQGNLNQEDNSKEKEQKDDLVVLVILLQILTPKLKVI